MNWFNILMFVPWLGAGDTEKTFILVICVERACACQLQLAYGNVLSGVGDGGITVAFGTKGTTVPSSCETFLSAP